MNRDRDEESGSLPGGGIEGDGPLVGLENPADDREPEPVPLAFVVKNRLKISSRTDSSILGPVSSIAISTVSRRGRTIHPVSSELAR